ncbi:MAG: hypothetical protein JXA25_13290 [Anaerolineales bacterium]|nr:hypothetical protein [Anaerolineales bacterium]
MTLNRQSSSARNSFRSLIPRILPGTVPLLFLVVLTSCTFLDLGDPLEATRLPSPLPPTLLQSTAEPEPTDDSTETPSVDPNVFVFQDGMVALVDWNGELLSRWDADGLNPENSVWYQVVGDSLYYLHEKSAKIYLTRAGSVVSLEFPGEEPINGFVVSENGSRIAWSVHQMGRNELWIANTNGLGRIRILDEAPPGSSMNELVLKPVQWIDNADLVYSWQYLEMGEEIWPDVFGSYYIYSPANDQITTAAALPESPAAPCWRGLTADALFLAGICGSDSQIEQLKVVEVNGDVEEWIPVVPGQNYAGEVAFSAVQRQIAYAVVDSILEDQASQVVLRSFPGDIPAVLKTFNGELVQRISWVDETRMLVEVEKEPQPYVLVLNVQGEQRILTEGWLLGWTLPAVEE